VGGLQKYLSGSAVCIATSSIDASRGSFQRRVGHVSRGHSRQTPSRAVTVCIVNALSAYSLGATDRLRLLSVAACQLRRRRYKRSPYVKCWPFSVGCSVRRSSVRLFSPENHYTFLTPLIHFFYHAMHFSAKRGLAIACRPSLCLSVCL